MIRRTLTQQVVWAIVILHLLVGCSAPVVTPTPVLPTDTPIPPADTPIPPTVTHTPTDTPTSSGLDYWPTEGWRTTTPEEQGMDSEMLVKMFEFILDRNYDIHSVTVVRNGYMVADATIYPFDPSSKHIIHSCTKSITSALIGIAIEQGYIESVKQPVLSFFPERTFANLDANKEAMTLEHLLMMASGLECRDSSLYNWRGLDQMMQTDDWVQFMLDLPMAESPGTRFEYCNGASFLLSAIIQETTDMGAAAFAEVHLFGPLGISDFAWPANPQGTTIGWGELRMRPHDMSKIGYLYLNNGQWESEQIVPADWVAASTQKHISTTSDDEYGYQWWIGDDGNYAALGALGQTIYVIPELDLVASFTSNLSEADISAPETLLNYIIAAAKSSTPLTPNPKGMILLESKIQQVALSQEEPETEPPLPEIARQVSGQTYVLDPNPLGLLTISFTFQEGAEALLSLTSTPDEWQGFDVDPQFWKKKVEWSIGLDNIYRFTPFYHGIPMALKGWWITEETFVLHNDFIGNTGQLRLQFTFDGDEVEILILEGPEHGTRISGRLDE